MLIKKGKPSLREQLECLSHGGKTPISPSSLSRRDFLGQALAVSAGSVLMPNVVGLLGKKLYAQDCPPLQAGSCGNFIPMLEYHTPGGGNFVEDFYCVTRDHQPFSNGSAYENYGHPRDADFNTLSPVSPIAGLKFHPNSPFLAGLQTTLTSLAGAPLATEILSRTAGFCIAVATGSDTESNRLSIMKGLSQLGIAGSLVKSGVGSGGEFSPTQNGGMRFAQWSDAIKATSVPVSNPQSARNLTGFGRLFQDLGSDRSQKILSTISQLSEKSRAAFSGMSLPQQVDTLVKCGFLNAKEIPTVFSPDNVFPATIPAGDPLLSAFTGGNSAVPAPIGNIGREGSTSALAVLSRLLADCTTLHAVINVDGYDNHNNTNIDPSRKRASTGVKLAQVLYYFHLRRRPIFFLLLTAGGMGVTRDDNTGALQIDNQTGRALHPGDSDNNAGIWGFIMHPERLGSEILENSNIWQVGEYGPGGVNRNYAVGGDQNLASLLAFRMYLQLHGLENQMTKVVRDDPFANNPIYNILKKITT